MDAHEMGYFTEENSAEVVAARNKNAESERLKEVMEVITRKLHEAVKEIEPTQQERFEAIMFLTKVGQMCDDWRQEYILLSDVLGVSMLVDAVNSRRPTGASENTVLGPFHVGDAPEYAMGHNICLDQKGEDMVVRGVSQTLTANRWKASKSTSGRQTTKGSMTFSKRASSPISICAVFLERDRMEITGSALSGPNIIRFLTMAPSEIC